jgi:uncharacterized repeat protein (TIGR01451 family)
MRRTIMPEWISSIFDPRSSILVLLVLVLLVSCLVAVAPAQGPQQPYGNLRLPPPMPPPPPNGTAPLLHVRFLGPYGMHVTFYKGLLQERTFPAPVQAAFRPGYVYRVELTGFTRHPGVSLFPTLEVRGTLRLPPKIAAAKYPAPVLVTDEDIDRALAGAFITKVVYLEHPDKAVPISSDPDNPGEQEVPPNRDLLKEARELGRPVLVLRLGQRLISDEDLANQAIPGTILLPGEGSLPLPRKGPHFPPVTWPWYDPFHGPRPPEEEYLHNGFINPSRGALGPAAAGAVTGPGLDNDGRLQGLRAEDTVAEYTDAAGRRGVIASNRVCLIVPRFGILRSELPLGQYDSIVGVTDAQCVQGQDLLRRGLPIGQTSQREQLRGIRGRERAGGAANVERLVPMVHLEVLEGVHVNLGAFESLCTKSLYQLTEIDMALLKRQIKAALALSGAERVSGFENFSGTAVVGRVIGGPEVVRATAETHDLTTVCCKEPPTAPEKPLVLIKWADRECAQVGDVVTFFLRYSNQGCKPITDVAVTDSLATRLEYVPGSAQSNRPAVFTTQENEAGSVILRWEITGRLLQGETGVIRFQARVR